jgi:hypothetical protein
MLHIGIVACSTEEPRSATVRSRSKGRSCSGRMRIPRFLCIPTRLPTI